MEGARCRGTGRFSCPGEGIHVHYHYPLHCSQPDKSSHLGRIVCASHARNSLKLSIQNNKDVLMASSPSSQKTAPLQHQNPKPRVGEMIRKLSLLNERSALSCADPESQLKISSRQRRRTVMARRRRGRKNEGHPTVRTFMEIFIRMSLVSVGFAVSAIQHFVASIG